MKIGRSNLIALLAIFALMAGCSVVRPREGTDTAKIERDIYRVTSAATTLAIKKIHEDDVNEQIKSAGLLVAKLDMLILPLITNPEAEITEVLADRILNEVPEEYRGLMAAAYETFNTHYSFPATSEILPDPYLGYLRSFVKGVRDGANKVLVDNNVHLDMDATIHLPE